MAESDQDVQPLISCILPTYNRRGFLPHAIHYFLRQDYPNKELLILDDGEESALDLMPADPQVVYLELKGGPLSIGLKRNTACELANGEIICHWDDDDIYGKHRISEQVTALKETGAAVTGYRDHLFLREDRKLWLYLGQGAYVVGVSLCYWKRYWYMNPFRCESEGEDNDFVASIPPGQLAIRNSNQIISRIHKLSACPKLEEVQLRNREYWREIT